MTRTWILTTEKIRVSSITFRTWMVGHIVFIRTNANVRMSLCISINNWCIIFWHVHCKQYLRWYCLYSTLNHNRCFILSSFLHHLGFSFFFFFYISNDTYKCGSNKNQETNIRRTKISLFNCCLQQYHIIVTVSSKIRTLRLHNTHYKKFAVHKGWFHSS